LRQIEWSGLRCLRSSQTRFKWLILLIPFTDYSKAKDHRSRHFRKNTQSFNSGGVLSREAIRYDLDRWLRIAPQCISCGYSKGLTKALFPTAKTVLPRILGGSGTQYKRLRCWLDSMQRTAGFVLSLIKHSLKELSMRRSSNYSRRSLDFG
jgi:hypothetical protein